MSECGLGSAQGFSTLNGETLMARFATAVLGMFLGLFSQANLAINYSDWWADPSYGGSSMNISQQGNSLGLAWYFYDTAGTATWIFGGGDLSGTTATLTLLSATGATLGAPASVTSVPIGTATITFTSDSAATFAFTYSGTSAYSGRSGQLALERYTLASLPIAGTYRYAQKAVQSGCTSADDNGTFFEFGTSVVTVANGNITFTNTRSDKPSVCSFSGPYVQHGSTISADMTFTCSASGAVVGSGNGRVDAAFRDDSYQLTATAQVTVGDTCRILVSEGGVRQ